MRLMRPMNSGTKVALSESTDWNTLEGSKLLRGESRTVPRCLLEIIGVGPLKSMSDWNETQGVLFLEFFAVCGGVCLNELRKIGDACGLLKESSTLCNHLVVGDCIGGDFVMYV